MELDIEKVLELYNKRVAELEHEIILLKAQIEQMRVSSSQENINIGEE